MIGERTTTTECVTGQRLVFPNRQRQFWSLSKKRAKQEAAIRAKQFLVHCDNPLHLVLVKLCAR